MGVTDAVEDIPTAQVVGVTTTAEPHKPGPTAADAMAGAMPTTDATPRGDPQLQTVSTGTAARYLRAAREETRKKAKSRSNVAILSSSQRGPNRWTVPRKLDAVAILGEVTLDFTRADFVHEETKISAVAILGSVDIVVPPGIQVVTDGFGLCGEFRGAADYHVDVEANGGMLPSIVLDGVALLGSVSVRVKDTVPALVVDTTTVF